MEKPEYEAPLIEELGSVRDLTLQFKSFGAADGVLFVPGDIPIGEVS